LNKKIYEKKVEIFWNKTDDEFINSLNLPKKFVHFHLVSRWLFKCIDDKISAKIIEFIEKELNLKVVLTAAPVKEEIEKINTILSLSKSNPINLSGKLTLKQTAALNKRAKFFVGVDTAIMHISAANDVPILSFFGPSGAFNWGPWDNDLNKSGYTKKNGFQKMGKHRVIQVDWDCAPCGQDGCNGSKISECLVNGLDFEFIKKNIEEINENI
jgi:heptosyltransferase-3